MNRLAELLPLRDAGVSLDALEDAGVRLVGDCQMTTANSC